MYKCARCIDFGTIMCFFYLNSPLVYYIYQVITLCHVFSTIVVWKRMISKVVEGHANNKYHLSITSAMAKIILLLTRATLQVGRYHMDNEPTNMNVA